MRMALTASLAFLQFVHSASAQDEALLRQRLDSEVPNKYAEFLEYTKRMKGRFTEKLIDAKTKETLRENEEIAKISGGLLLHKLETKVLGSVEGANINLKPSAYGKNSRYTFQLHKSQSAGAWLLQEWATNDKIDKKSKIGMADELLNQPLPSNVFGPHFVIFNRSLPKLLADPRFTLKKAEYVAGDKSGLVRVSFTHRAAGPREGLEILLDGSMILDSENFWCIPEYDIQVRGPAAYTGFQRGKNEYSIEKETGLPMPTRSILAIGSGKDDEMQTITEMKVEFHQGLPESEFTLTAFGLPEPMGMPRVDLARSRWHIWLGASALGCLVLVVACRRAVRYYAAKRLGPTRSA